MCDKCDEIDRRIEKFKIIVARYTDKQMVSGIAAAIAELEDEKTALHAERK